MDANLRDFNVDNIGNAADSRETPSLHAPRRIATPNHVRPATLGTGWYHEAAIEAAQRKALEARCRPEHW